MYSCAAFDMNGNEDSTNRNSRQDATDGINPTTPVTPQSDVAYPMKSSEPNTPINALRGGFAPSTIPESQSPSSHSLSTQKILPPIKPGESSPKEDSHSEKEEQNEQKNPKKIQERFHIHEKSLDEVLSGIQRCLENLQALDDEDYTTGKAGDDLTYLKEASRYGERGPARQAVYQAYTDHGVPELFRRIWKRNTQGNFLSRENPHLFNNMKDILIVLWNGTDMSKNLVDACLKINLHEDVLFYLNHEKFDTSNLKSVFKRYLVRGLMGITNNLVQMSDCVHVLRELDAVRIFTELYKAKDDMIPCKALMVLAYLITEEENEIINGDDANFKFMVKILESCLTEESLHSKKYGFSAHEMVEALNRLAANDQNKHRIIRNGVLPLYVQMMQPEMGEREQRAACQGMWTLAFRCADDIQNEPGCMEALKHLATKSSSVDVKKQASGALWIISGWKKDHKTHKRKKKASIPFPLPEPSEEKKGAAPPPPPPSAPGLPVSPAPKEDEHVFISYNWSSKETVLKIKEHLKSAGYLVWMDVDNMSGSILEAMALAVEKAAVVLICFSQKYKESPNCRTEAEYTFKLGKSIVPLRMQYRYQADGWLGALLGNKLYFDFSSDNKFEQSLIGLEKELGNRGHPSIPHPPPLPVQPFVSETQHAVNPVKSHEDHSSQHASSEVPAKVPVEVPTPSPVIKETIGRWNEQDVKAWLQKSGLGHMVSRFTGFDGYALLEYRYMLAQAPEFFYSSLKQDIGLTLLESLRFCKLLKEVDLH